MRVLWEYSFGVCYFFIPDLSNHVYERTLNERVWFFGDGHPGDEIWHNFSATFQPLWARTFALPWRVLMVGRREVWVSSGNQGQSARWKRKVIPLAQIF